MQKNLVIVESPAKAKTIEKFLGPDFKVMSSLGHIRDLKKKNFGVDLETFEPQYEIPADKRHVVSDLRAQAKASEAVWLASDEPRGRSHRLAPGRGARTRSEGNAPYRISRNYETGYSLGYRTSAPHRPEPG